MNESLGSLGSLGSNQLGSLAQSARSKNLKSAKTILISLGILIAGANCVIVFIAPRLIEGQIDAERKHLAPGFELNQADVEEFRTRQTRIIQTAGAIGVLVGLIFITLGLLVYKYPTPITITGLVLFIGWVGINAAMDPRSLVSGWWLKLIVVVGLFKAVQAAIASEKEKDDAAFNAPPAAI